MRACVCVYTMHWARARAGSMLPSSVAQGGLRKLFLVKLWLGGRRPAAGSLPGGGVVQAGQPHQNSRAGVPGCSGR